MFIGNNLSVRIGENCLEQLGRRELPDPWKLVTQVDGQLHETLGHSAFVGGLQQRAHL